MIIKPMNGSTDHIRRALRWRRAPFDETIEITTKIELMVPLHPNLGVGLRSTATDVDLQTQAEGTEETVDGAFPEAEDWLYGHVDAAARNALDMFGHTVHVVETPLGSAEVPRWWSRTGVIPAGREGTSLELALEGRQAELLEVAAGVAAKRRVLLSERGAELEIERGAEGVRWWICAQPNGREIAAGVAVTATVTKHIAEAALEPGLIALGRDPGSER
jgi:hypothetical protein